MNFDEVDKAMRAARVETFAKMRAALDKDAFTINTAGNYEGMEQAIFPVTPAATAEQNVAKLSADHAHLKAWNEELVAVLTRRGCCINWATKDQIEEAVDEWLRRERLKWAQKPEQQYPRCLAALEEKLAENDAVWRKQEEKIASLTAELETCRRSHQA